MDFSHSPRAQQYLDRVGTFLREQVEPVERALHGRLVGEPSWTALPEVAELKRKARDAGLWNLFLPGEHGGGLTNLEYAPLAELMGRTHLGAEAMNCSAPDTGNMEVLLHFGSAEQKQRWLTPLLEGGNPLGVLHDRAGRRVVGRHEPGGDRRRRG